MTFCLAESLVNGYNVHDIAARFLRWYREGYWGAQAVLKAVNLGGDTDTTACVTGALAGLYYGESGVPAHWRKSLAREKDIVKLSEHFTQSLKKRILPEKD